uniref:Centromere kinetochore component CENP-T N-terminal domain-containing protein n=1 Tax=Spermophilus dauricus TaxID=99837 RepID=A0A8C9USP8_SPEDA
MADNWDSEPTIRTVLQRVLDNADSRTPRRPRSSGAGAQRALLKTSSSRRLSSRTKTSAKQRSHGVRSIGRLAHIQVIGNLKEQTPRTLVENILITASAVLFCSPKIFHPHARGPGEASASTAGGPTLQKGKQSGQVHSELSSWAGLLSCSGLGTSWLQMPKLGFLACLR